MKNWTDPIIHWNQLPGTEVKRLIATWGMSPEQIAKYDRKHGHSNSVSKTEAAPAKSNKSKAKAEVVEVPKPTRQRHKGADGEIKFVDHRNLYVGFWGGKVVVTKRTREACLAVLQKDYNFEG
jgi:hypothetical protein